MIRALKLTTDALAVLGAVGILAMMVHIPVDVFLRELFGLPVPGTIEIVSRYDMVAVGFLALPWAIRRGQMIKAELLGSLFTGRIGWLNAILGQLLCALAYGILAWTTWAEAMKEFRSGTFVMSLNTALVVWPGYFFLPVAFALAFVVAATSAGLLMAGRDPAVLADEPARP